MINNQLYIYRILRQVISLPLEQIRWIKPIPDGIKVTVYPIQSTLGFDGLKLADIINPDNGKLSFQTKYKFNRNNNDEQLVKFYTSFLSYFKFNLTYIIEKMS